MDLGRGHRRPSAGGGRGAVLNVAGNIRVQPPINGKMSAINLNTGNIGVQVRRGQFVSAVRGAARIVPSGPSALLTTGV